MNIIKSELQELKRNTQVIGYIITWKELKKGDVGEWVEATGIKRSVLLTGELGSADCKIEGSNDKENVGILHSDFDRELSLEIGNFHNIKEVSKMIRPNVNNGDDNTNLTVSIMVVL